MNEMNRLISTQVRKRSVGIIDMGGGSLQIAFEITKNKRWRAIQAEGSTKDFIAEFNLGETKEWRGRHERRA